MAIPTNRTTYTSVCISLIFVWIWSAKQQLKVVQRPPQTAQPSSPQSAAAHTAQADAGLETPWNARKMVLDLYAESAQLQPLLAALNPQQWYDKKGAPSTYIIQWQTAQRQLNDVRYATQLLEQRTESLSTALDAYFRLEALDVTERSLEEGAQRYAERSTADQLGALIAKGFNSREHLRDYLQELAASTEQNFKVADEEAQRCRANISKQPSPSRKR